MQNTVGKLLEKIVARKLSLELEEKGLLPPELGSYRQGKDTWANAAVLASDVYDGFSTNFTNKDQSYYNYKCMNTLKGGLLLGNKVHGLF